MTMVRLARGLRNNNPGNIRRVRGQRWRGQCPEQQDPAFVQFTSPEWGYRATMTALVAAMSRVENGVPADLAAVDRAFGLLDTKD